MTDSQHENPKLDPERATRAVLAGKHLVTAKYWEYPHHTHIRSQLIYTSRGLVNCEVENYMGVIPPNCALWIPGGVSHSLRGWGAAECFFLYVDEGFAPPGLAEFKTLIVSPLLRELIKEAANQPRDYDEGGASARLMATLLDQLTIAPSESLQLPMPLDVRIRRMALALLDDPSDKSTLSDWGVRIGMSERNLNRLLVGETGMSFSRWKRQLHLVYALRRLIGGDKVQDIALDLGYDNASGFITMFRKLIGKPPARYLADVMVPIVD